MLNEDVLQEFIFDCQLRKLSERTIKEYKNNNKKMMRFIEQEYQVVEIEQVYYQHIQGYIIFLTKQQLSEAYINGLIKCFRAFFQYCRQEGYIIRNPMDKIKFPKEPIPIIETFTNQEVAKMIHAYRGSRFLDVRNQMIMVLLFDTGMRNSELCGLKVSDMRGSHIHILGKGKKTRFVPITPFVNKYLIRYLRVRAEYVKDKYGYETDYLLLSQKGKKLTPETLERVVRDAGQACGVRSNIRVSPHTCRHFYAQSQLKNGCDVYTVSKLLGHSKLDITKRYLQSMKDEDLLEMAAKTSPLMCL